MPRLIEHPALPASVTAGLTPELARGADLFVRKDCIACHAIAGAGGRKGPDLTTVGSRLSHDRLVQTILVGRPGGMPAYAESITPEQVDDLVAFLASRK